MKRSLLPASLIAALAFASAAAADNTDFTQPAPFRVVNIVELVDGHASCRAATMQETLRMRRPDRSELRVIYSRDRGIATNASGQAVGLKINLRSTAQLDQFPAAKAAFIRAAQIWEARIANPMTVFIDVDFGPTRFGDPYPNENVIGSTDSDDYGGGEGTYKTVRDLLQARADNALEATAYGALPTSSLPTDLGFTTRAMLPSILLRAVGGKNAVADPNNDTAPTIGFNSNFAFDLDPSNGIDGDKMDFEAVTVHEIGHALGFGSSVGWTETDATVPVVPTLFDFFRFRPGVSMGTFTNASRPQTSGGDQVYFAGQPALRLSTGRGDGTGGDEQQASHWKDDSLTGVYIGLMDPNIDFGARGTLTANDLAAFDMMGYRIVQAVGCSESEPNETVNQASALVLPGPCSGSVASSDASVYSITYGSGTTDFIEDMFSVTLPSSGKVTVTMSFSTLSADLDLFLFRLNGSQLQIIDNSSGSDATEQITSPTLAAGTYYVGVTSFAGSSTYSVSASFAPTPTVPAAPTNLRAVGTSATTIRLTWTDNSTNETEFRIEQKVGSSFVDLGAVAANGTAVNITGVNPGVAYTFRVRARNEQGNSGYSNEATATTSASAGGRRRSVGRR